MRGHWNGKTPREESSWKRRMRWTEHVGRPGEERLSKRAWQANVVGRRKGEDRSSDGKTASKTSVEGRLE